MTLTSSTLAATLAAAMPYAGDIAVAIGAPQDPAGYVPVDAFRADPERAVQEAMTYARERTERLDRRTLTAQVVQQLALATQPVAAALGIRGRAVEWNRAQIALGEFRWRPAVALGEARVTCAATDPAAGQPDTEVVRTPDAVQDRWIREVVDDYLRPIAAAAHLHSGFSLRALEALAAEPPARAFMHARRAASRQWRGDTERLVTAMGLAPSLPPAIDVHRIDGEEEAVLRGRACCRYHVWPGGERCEQCVLHTDEQRAANAREDARWRRSRS